MARSTRRRCSSRHPSGAFWHMRQRQLWRVAAWGLVAGLTRAERRVSQRAARPARPHGDGPAGRGSAPLARAPAFPRSWPRPRRVSARCSSRCSSTSLTGNPFEWAAIQERWGRTVGGATAFDRGHHSATWRSTGCSSTCAPRLANFINLAAAAFAAALDLARNAAARPGLRRSRRHQSRRAAGARRRHLDGAPDRHHVPAVPVARRPRCRSGGSACGCSCSPSGRGSWRCSSTPGALRIDGSRSPRNRRRCCKPQGWQSGSDLASAASSRETSATDQILLRRFGRQTQAQVARRAPVQRDRQWDEPWRLHGGEPCPGRCRALPRARPRHPVD